MDILKELVNSYMCSEWKNKRREVTYYKAREELLGGATLHSFSVGTTEPKCTYLDELLQIANANPKLFDSFGFIDGVHIKDVTLIVVKNSKGIILLSGNVSVGVLNT